MTLWHHITTCGPCDPNQTGLERRVCGDYFDHYFHQPRSRSPLKLLRIGEQPVMASPGEQRTKPRKRDRVKNLLKDTFSFRTPSPSPSRTTDDPNAPRAPAASSGAAGKIYEGVKTTLRKIIEVSDVFPPVKSVAAGLLVICDTIDVRLPSSET